MLRALALSLILLLISSLGFSQTQAEIAPKFRAEFKRILVDVRNNRFGAGDVAASYLTITDLIKTYGVNENISILTNDASAKILRKLAHGNQEFFDHVTIYSLRTLPASEMFDLYLSFANKNGQFENERDFNEKYADRAIHLDRDAVLISQTVLGNTENKLFHLQQATMRFHGVDRPISYPGVAPGEAGVYDDFIAKQLKASSTAHVDDFLAARLHLVDDTFSAAALRGLLDHTKLKGASIGLAYGLSSAKTQQPQFITYLKGLAAQTTESFCVLTPASVDPNSGFTSASVTDSELLEKLVFVKSLEEMPGDAQAGKIYVVRTQNLPHSVFVGLMARSMKSGLVPVGAGDGFISAALNLGGPFVLTRVPWNAKNIEALKQRLLSESDQSTDVLQLIEDVFGSINLERSQDIRKLSKLFARVGEMTPSFTDKIVNESYSIRHLAAERPEARPDVHLAVEPIEARSTKPRLIFGSAYGSHALSCDKAAIIP